MHLALSLDEKCKFNAIAINRSADMLKCFLHFRGTYPDLGSLKGVHAHILDYFPVLMLNL
jgi:hypothetical protein